MPNSKPQRRGYEEKDGKVKSVHEKAMSFHESGSPEASEKQKLRRPKTVPADLPSLTRTGVSLQATTDGRPKLTKVLLNVTIQGSLGAVQVLMSPELTVGDLIAAAARQYVKEGRRPVLPTSVSSGFNLHYSQFSLERLDREERLATLGSRNFFLCTKKLAADSGSDSDATSCSKEAEKSTKPGVPWFKFMNFLHNT
ncbi:hypothetical protein Nepgr_014000 [Nepenthes gracilis]|uniref:DUF7054 domain-containing protein n=1 Tax=Nepenthes gracilis TaxID=150966 RepID=A0AAD3SJY4_NEPGR|nr:hypothetical protein Nepgr_014000 [Nepenthes gracilis]